MDILGGQHWILGGGLRHGVSWVGELIATSSFIVAREQSITVNEKARIDLQMKISIDNRPAPMGVIIDLIKDSTFYGITEPKKTCSFWTVWGDDGATFNNSPQFKGLNNANRTYGCKTGHVYVSPGTYTATSYCVHWTSGKKGKITHTFTVGADADTVYAGANTVYLDSSGTFPNTQAGWQEFDNWPDARSAIAAAGSDTRFLQEAGSDVIQDTLGLIYDRCQWGVIGSGARPKLRIRNSGITSFTDASIYNDSGVGTGEGTIIWGFDIVGNYDAESGTGETKGTTGFYLHGSQKLTIWDVGIYGTGIPIRFRDGVLRCSELLIADCNITDWQDLSIFGSLDNSVIIGNSVKQNANAISGPAAKEEYRNEIPGDGSTLTHTLTDVAIFGDVDTNLKVFVRVDSTDVYTQLIKDTDFTFTEGSDPTNSGSNNGTHQITLNSAVAVGSTLIAHTKYYAAHGPIRLEECRGVAITNNNLLSKTGWSYWNQAEGVFAVQSCIRWGSNGAEGDWGVIAYNNLENGADIIQTAPANDGIRQYPTDVLLIEQNYFTSNDNTEFGVRMGKSNIFARNNYIIQNDQEIIDSNHPFQSFARAGKNGVTLTDVDTDPIYVYNTTVISLVSTANNAGDITAISEGIYPFPDVYSGNNLEYHPDNVAVLPDYTPLDENDFYRPQEGSAALDGGTPINLVWDDLAGNLVGETASIGAFDSVSPIQPSFTLSGDGTYLHDKVNDFDVGSSGVPLSWYVDMEISVPDASDILQGLFGTSSPNAFRDATVTITAAGFVELRCLEGTTTSTTQVNDGVKYKYTLGWDSINKEIYVKVNDVEIITQVLTSPYNTALSPRYLIIGGRQTDTDSSTVNIPSNSTFYSARWVVDEGGENENIVEWTSFDTPVGDGGTISSDVGTGLLTVDGSGITFN